MTPRFAIWIVDLTIRSNEFGLILSISPDRSEIRLTCMDTRSYDNVRGSPHSFFDRIKDYQLEQGPSFGRFLIQDLIVDPIQPMRALYKLRSHCDLTADAISKTADIVTTLQLKHDPHDLIQRARLWVWKSHPSALWY